jgi:hypothetical protein
MLNPENTREVPESVLNWAPDAPKGGKAVMNRVLKDGASVPLFFAQTLIASLRDVGYNTTTSAICEHVDNAIQAGATEVRVYFRQTGKQKEAVIDAAVYDNGSGMAPNVLKVATSFGGSMSFNNRSGIGRFGMGMKTAALSMSPVMELYSWQEAAAYYNMTLDVEAIGKERARDPRDLRAGQGLSAAVERRRRRSRAASPRRAEDQTRAHSGAGLVNQPGCAMERPRRSVVKTMRTLSGVEAVGES